MTGFLIGGLAGSALALLLAPQSGEATKTQIRDQSLKLKERAEEQIADTRARVNVATEDARQQVENIRERASRIQEQGRTLIEEKTNKVKETANKAKARIAEVV